VVREAASPRCESHDSVIARAPPDDVGRRRARPRHVSKGQGVIIDFWSWKRKDTGFHRATAAASASAVTLPCVRAECRLFGRGLAQRAPNRSTRALAEFFTA
jgi:predicted kinase